MMAQLEFYPLDVVYKIEDGRAVLYLYGKSGNERVCVKYPRFDPYFLVIPKGDSFEELQRKLSNFKINIDGREAEITKVEVVEKRQGLKQRRMLKCHTPIPKDIPKISAEIAKLHEVESVEERDIKFVNRFLIDNKITLFQRYTAIGDFEQSKNKARVFRATKLLPSGEETISNLKLLSFDIETGAKENNPNENPILMIAVYTPQFKKVITWQRFPTKLGYVEFVENEGAMIERFAQILKEEAPDIICGYFSDEFDLPYINIRAQKLGVDFKPGLNYSGISHKRGRTKESYIEGITHIDVFKFIRYIWALGLETNFYDLDSVAREILKEGKEEVDIGLLGEAWQEGGKQLETYCKYNLKDALLCFKLCETIMPDIVEFVKLTGMTPFQVCRSRYSKLVEGYLISKAYELGVLVPSMPTHDDVRERRQSSYKGAFVYEPKPGLYENIAVFDFRSLYPTIIVAHNISPETLKCECCKTATVPGRNDLWFCTKVKGFIPTVIRELITRRMRLKRIMKEQKQGVEVLRARDYALKTLANSMYGYLGFFASRWYSFESALSITAYGRFYLNMVIERAKKHGFNVIYGDTDSIFLELGEHKLEEALEFVNGINSELPEMMELKFEGFYPRGIFVSMKDTSMGAKKKYALVNKEGEITVRGFETVRRNWSLLAREAQMRVLEIVLKDKDIERAVEYIKELIKRVKSNQVSKEMMVIKTQIQKPISEYESIAPHVAVAKKLIERGQKVEIGDIIEYVIINGSGRIGDRAEPAEFVEEPDYDAEYYVKNQILPAVDTIFRELGVDIAEEVASKDQSKLNKFF